MSPVFAGSRDVSHHRGRYPHVSHYRVGHHHISRPHVRHYRVSHHHVRHHADWGLFGIGLLTGAVVTNLFYATSPREVVVYREPAVVHYPDPVIIQEPPGIVEVPGNPLGEAVVTVALLNVRSGPGKSYPVIHQVWRNSRLAIQGSSQGWFYVSLPSGNSGWVMREFTARVQAPASG